MEIRDYIRVLWRRWPITAGAIVLAVVAACLATFSATPRYASTVTLFVSAPGTGSANGVNTAYEASLLSQQRVRSYAELLGSRQMAQRLADDLNNIGEQAEAQTLTEQIQVEAVPDSVLLRATVIDPSPQRAAHIAEALATGFARMVEGLESSTSDGTSPIKVTMVGSPQTSTQPVSPQPLHNLTFGLLAGLALGIGASLLRERLDNTVRGSELVRELTGSPTLGEVCFDRAMPTRPLLAHIDVGAPRAEAFRTLRTNLKFLDVDRPSRTVLISSCRPADGKSITACNLALSLVEGGSRVALVDADLRRPRMADYLGIEGAVGLTTVLIGQATLDDVLQPWGQDGLLVLPSGPIPPNPAELLGSQHMQEIVFDLAGRVDTVIIDTAPLLPVTDAAVLARICDGVLLVIRHGRTTRDQLMVAKGRIEAVHARVLGHIVNMAPPTKTNSYGYGSVYGGRSTATSGCGIDELMAHHLPTPRG